MKRRENPRRMMFADGFRRIRRWSIVRTGRSFKIPDQKDQASDITDFELVTWLVIKQP